MAGRFHASLARYLLVGITATALHLVVLLGLVELGGLPPASSAAFGALCGALAAYEGNYRFTFGGTRPRFDALLRFLTVAALGAAANGAFVWAGTEMVGEHYLAVQAFATAVVFFAGFVLNQRWTFA